MKKIIKTILLLLILSAVLLMLGMTGRGLSGLYLVLLTLFLLIIFLFLVFRHDREVVNYKISDKLFLFAEIFLISFVVIFWISINDFYFIEMFKNFGFDFADNTYWVVFFSGTVPIIFTIIAVVYFLGSYHFSNTLRILLLAVFITNSNLNDFLYYLIVNEPLPEVWPWLHQPSFLFDASINTLQLFIWTIFSIVMGFIVFLLPYEALTIDYFDDLADDKRTIKKKLYHLAFVILFCGLSIYYAYTMIPIIKTSVQANGPIAQAMLSGEVKKRVDKVFPEAESYFSEADKSRIELAKNIINYLNSYYELKGRYPASKGNCMKDWDSSFYSFPFYIKDFNLVDPEQKKSLKCDFTEKSKNILYYSDSKRFALVFSGETIPDGYTNLYIPGRRDVYWFSEDVLFFRDWNWNNKMIVFMYEKGGEVTIFSDLEESNK
jgi:hypothetical protein